MSRPRLVVALALAVLAAAAPAHAAPKRRPPVICNLVKDPAADAALGATAPNGATYSPSLDIVSGDVGVTATMLTVAIRVKQLTETDNLAPGGRTWSLAFANGTYPIQFTAYKSPLGGDRFSTGMGTFDYKNNEIRITTKLSSIPDAKIKKGSVLRGFYLTSNAILGLDPSLGAGPGLPLGGATDTTDATSAAFTVGSLSCVKVG